MTSVVYAKMARELGPENEIEQDLFIWYDATGGIIFHLSIGERMAGCQTVHSDL